MGAKSILFAVSILFVASIAIAQTPMVGFVAPTSDMWNCTGYCDYNTNCGWTNQIVESETDPSSDICCVEGISPYSPYGPAPTSPIEKIAFIVGAKHYWTKCIPIFTPEICNGLDDDGDGLIDEDLSQSCSTDVGICTEGVETCTNGVWSDCTGTLPQTETCNGLDDDCDGTTDEGCITYTTYTGYDHYCEDITLSQNSDVSVYGYFQSINDSYLRYFIISLDCPYSEGRRVYLSSGCSYENCDGGRYCYMGVGSSGTYTYQFNNLIPGSHRICLWPTSIRGYLWNISMSYTAIPNEPEPPTCTVGDDCTVIESGECDEWLCSGYCDKPTGYNYCYYISNAAVNSTSDPTGTSCCSYDSGGPPCIGDACIYSSEKETEIDEEGLGKYAASFVAPGIITKYWESCTFRYPECIDGMTTISGYYNADCVCTAKKAIGQPCTEDYECYNSQCISGICQVEEPDRFCGDGVCELPESDEYCGLPPGSYCAPLYTEAPSIADYWVYCPQDCGTGSYCGDGTCDPGEAETCTDDCGYLTLSIAVPNVTVGNKAYFSLFYSVAPVVTGKDPSGASITITPQPYESSSEGGIFSRVYEFTPGSTGVYTITAYIKIDGIKTKEVTGTINVLAPLPTDTCGDGICGTTETNLTCPDDCYVEPERYCGDGICESYETSCYQDCGFLNVYTTKKSAYIDDNIEFRVNHTSGEVTITVYDPSLNEVSFYSIYNVTECTTDFCLDKYSFKPAKEGTYTVSVQLSAGNTTLSDSDYVVVSKKEVDPNWILLTSSDHVDSGNYLCGGITLEHQSIVKIKGVFRNINDYYARFLLSCVDCDDILNTWALTTSAGWALYGTETRCETEKTEGEFCIMGCCSEGTYIKSHNISAGTHRLCIWPTCPDKYYDIDRVWEADLYYNISYEYIETADPGTPVVNVTEPYCGNGVHDPGENHKNCCIDVGCPAHQYCSESNECVKENLPPGGGVTPNETESYCGDGVHDPGETKENCCIDVGCPAHHYCSESIMKCVREAKDMNPTVGLALALNAETLYIRMSNLRDRVAAIRDYYQGKDPEKYGDWDNITLEFESIISSLEDMKDYLRDNKEDLTNSVFEEARRMIIEIKANIRELIVKILEVL